MTECGAINGVHPVCSNCTRDKIENAHIDEFTGDIVISLGDITPIYDRCGCLGICSDCRENGRDGCGEHYVVGTVRSQ